MWVEKKIKNVLILLPAWAWKIVQKVTISPNNGNGSFNVIKLFQLIYHIWFLVQCLLGEIRIVQSIFLHNLEDLLSDITVSGENVGIVGRNFNSSFRYVISHFNCFHKLCCMQLQPSSLDSLSIQLVAKPTSHQAGSGCQRIARTLMWSSLAAWYSHRQEETSAIQIDTDRVLANW